MNRKKYKKLIINVFFLNLEVLTHVYVITYDILSKNTKNNNRKSLNHISWL